MMLKKKVYRQLRSVFLKGILDKLETCYLSVRRGIIRE